MCLQREGKKTNGNAQPMLDQNTTQLRCAFLVIRAPTPTFYPATEKDRCSRWGEEAVTKLTLIMAALLQMSTHFSNQKKLGARETLSTSLRFGLMSTAMYPFKSTTETQLCFYKCSQ